MIVEIDIPARVTTIGDNAFAWCTRLERVGISRDSGLTSIGDHAFDNTAISEIYLPDTVTSIGKCAFRNCEFLTSVTLPKDIESIEDGVFYGCASLTEAIISSGVTSIGEYAFGSCEKLDNVVLPSALNYIGACAFAECSALSEIDIPKNVEIIGDRAFQFCSGLKYLGFESGSNLSVIPYGMCMNCVQLERANIPTSVTEIGSDAFHYCYRLKYQPFDHLGALNEIGSSAFYRCAFTEVVLPRTLQSLAYDTFGSCYMLQKIHVTNTTYMMQIVGEADDLMPLIDLPVLDGIYVYDVRLAMEYKWNYDTLADYIVTVGFDWALVTDSYEISDRYVFDYVFKYNIDPRALITIVGNEAVNGVLFYLTGNDVYEMSCYAEICCYDIPVIVITPGSVTEREVPYTIIKADDYSLGYGIAKSYIDGLYDYAGVYLYDIL
ncbi:MAG: leucine-rich repeat domain-containing protein, partial [Clostridia bacterium]|nr:leucine-rich repeat domain-containing protein [Clostridia bacterium]